mgnify:FL=1
MNNIFVYCGLEDNKIADISLELMTKGRKLADSLKCNLDALIIGHDLQGIEKQLYLYGADTVYIADDKRLSPYTTLPHTSITVKLFQEQNHKLH